MDAQRERQASDHSQSPALKDPNGALDEFVNLCERFDNRLAIDDLRLIERYRNGNLNLLLEAQVRGSIDFFIICQGINDPHVLGNAEACAKWTPPGSRTADSTLAIWADEKQRYTELTGRPDVRGPYWNDSLVFVQDIQFVENPQRGVPSLVWLQSSDQPLCTGGDAPYFTNSVGFKMFLGPADRETSSPSHLAVRISLDEGANKLIQRRSKIVDNIPNDHAKLAWDCLVDSDAIDILSSFCIVLMDNFIWAGIVEGSDPRLQLSDVAFGPFDF